MKILVTGATGKLGSAVIETLLKKMPAQQVSIITRKEEKRAELEAKGLKAYLGDYDDIKSLEKSMHDVDTVLLISSDDQGDRMQQHRNVINAAKKMNVKNIAYTSRSLRDKATLSNLLMGEHFETEDYIKESGLNYLIFRNALYMEVIPYYVGKELEKGIYLTVGDGRVAFAMIKDMGEGIANVLLNENFEKQTYNFTGNEAYSFYDVASALSELSGKVVKYTPVDIPTSKANMIARGLPEEMIKKIIDFNTDIKNGQEAEVTYDLENKLGRKPTSLKDGLKIIFKL